MLLREGTLKIWGRLRTLGDSGASPPHPAVGHLLPRWGRREGFFGFGATNISRLRRWAGRDGRDGEERVGRKKAQEAQNEVFS